MNPTTRQAYDRDDYPHVQASKPAARSTAEEHKNATSSSDAGNFTLSQLYDWYGPRVIKLDKYLKDQCTSKMQLDVELCEANRQFTKTLTSLMSLQNEAGDDVRQRVKIEQDSWFGTNHVFNPCPPPLSPEKQEELDALKQRTTARNKKRAALQTEGDQQAKLIHSIETKISMIDVQIKTAQAERTRVEAFFEQEKQRINDSARAAAAEQKLREGEARRRAQEAEAARKKAQEEEAARRKLEKERLEILRKKKAANEAKAAARRAREEAVAEKRRQEILLESKRKEEAARLERETARQGKMRSNEEILEKLLKEQEAGMARAREARRDRQEKKRAREEDAQMAEEAAAYEKYRQEQMAGAEATEEERWIEKALWRAQQALRKARVELWKTEEAKRRREEQEAEVMEEQKRRELRLAEEESRRVQEEQDRQAREAEEESQRVQEEKDREAREAKAAQEKEEQSWTQVETKRKKGKPGTAKKGKKTAAAPHCQHKKWWTPEPRCEVCSNCEGYTCTYRCPGCGMTACEPCRDILRRR